MRNTVVHGNDGDRVEVIVVPEALDEHNLPEFSKNVDRILDNGCRLLVFNTSRITFIKEVAIASWIGVQKRLSMIGVQSALSEPSVHLQALIDTLGLTPILKIFPSDEEAVRYLQRGSS